MKKIAYIVILLIAAATTTKAQQGFGTSSPALSSVIDITTANKGALFPHIALTGITDVTTIPAAANALTVFNTATTTVANGNDVTPGYYYWNSTSAQWVRLLTSTDAPNWLIKGNAGTTTSSFLGTTDAQDLVLKTAATERLRITSAGNIDIPNSTATTGIITKSNYWSFIHNILPGNLGVGVGALNINTTGDRNIALGTGALMLNTTGTDNISIGQQSLITNLTASKNIAVGGYTLAGNTTVANSLNNNVSVGNGAGASVTGNNNVILGSTAGFTMATGSNAVLIGYTAGSGNGADNRLIIDNAGIINDKTPLLDGDFAGRVLTINKTLKVADLAGGAAATTGNRPVVAAATGGQLMIGSLASANGLTTTADGTVQLGGALTSATTITTSATNTLILDGLPVSAATDDYTLVSDASTGQVKRIPQENVNANQWKLAGNTGTTTASFLGTTDTQDLVFETNSLERLRLSQTGRLLFANTSGTGTNLFIGDGSETTTGTNNVVLGLNALVNNTGGSFNIVTGSNALAANTTGEYNIAYGPQSLAGNISGVDNIALGYQSLNSNIGGSDNIAIGKDALLNSTGNNNIAIGTSSLLNTTVDNNTAVGYNTLVGNTTGANNTAIGYLAGAGVASNNNVNTSGSNNILIGTNATIVSAGLNNQLNIGNNIFGTDLTSTDATAPAGLIGIGTATPNSTLQVSGSFSLPAKRVTTTTTYTVSANDYKILVNRNGLVTITLPDPTTCPGRMYVIQNVATTPVLPISSAGVAFNYPISVGRGVVIAANTTVSTTINSSTGTSPNFTYLSGMGIELQSDGTVWTGITQ